MKPSPIKFKHRREYDILCNQEDARHKRAMDRFKTALKELQAACPHKRSTFQGDPAGGNDSCYVCDDCDKVL